MDERSVEASITFEEFTYLHAQVFLQIMEHTQNPQCVPKHTFFCVFVLRTCACFLQLLLYYVLINNSVKVTHMPIPPRVADTYRLILWLVCVCHKIFTLSIFSAVTFLLKDTNVCLSKWSMWNYILYKQSNSLRIYAWSTCVTNGLASKSLTVDIYYICFSCMS